MNAYNHFFAHTKAKKVPAPDQPLQAPRYSPLTEPQMEFLNPCACWHVSPYNPYFWSELRNVLSGESQAIQDLPKAAHYRDVLEPYLLQRVHMTAETWSVSGCGRNQVHLLLKNIRLTHVPGGALGSAPNIALDHLNVWVSPLWLNHVIPVWGEPLALDGMLCEYAASNHTRNIGLLPVLLMPRNHRNRTGSPARAA